MSSSLHFQPVALSDFSQNRYLAYPHANGFSDEGRSIVMGWLSESETGLVRRGILSGIEVPICSFPRESEPEKLLWFDVAEASNTLVTIAQNSVWLFDLKLASDPGIKLFRAGAGQHIHPLPSISRDGVRVLVGCYSADRYAAVVIDTSSGEVRELFSHPWHANHFHFCPHDESWIGYSHEGPADSIRDRIWAWHPELAPRGKCVFDQTGSNMALGHERWCFHQTSAIGVAYGLSYDSPRGLFEFYADGREPRLISAADRDWHAGISRDGKWAVVDTSGPHDIPGIGWQDAQDISDVLLVDMETGKRSFLARSRQYMRHPRHPHPVFSPDGSWIFFNESSSDAKSNRVWMLAVPEITAI